MSPVTARQQSCGKVMFSVTCVSHSVHRVWRGRSVQGPGSSLPCTGCGRVQALIPTRQVQTGSLCIPHCQQVGRWHSTEMPSCLKIRLHLFLTYLSFIKTAPATLRFHGKVYIIEDSVDECEEKGGKQMAIDYHLVLNSIQSKKTFQNDSEISIITTDSLVISRTG